MADHNVIACGKIGKVSLMSLLQRYQLKLHWLPLGLPIPGSYWGDSEAGLMGNCVVVRDDTPVHSVLHEACHYICMDAQRRTTLHTDAGGNDEEENAVCYLQLLLVDYLHGINRERLYQDMDCWGYSFRLGSACLWFTHDAHDAHQWLLRYKLIDQHNKPSWRLRSS